MTNRATIEVVVAVVAFAIIVVALWRYGGNRDQKPDTSFTFGRSRSEDQAGADKDGA